jgi:hypothetical protein
MNFHSCVMYVANGTGQFEPVFYSTSGTVTIPLCLSRVALKFDYTIVCWCFLYCETHRCIFISYLRVHCSQWAYCLVIVTLSVFVYCVCNVSFISLGFSLVGTCVTYVLREFIFPVITPWYCRSSGSPCGNVVATTLTSPIWRVETLFILQSCLVGSLFFVSYVD